RAIPERPERETGGSVVGGGVRSGCVTRSPDSQPSGLRTGRGGPTPPERTPPPPPPARSHAQDFVKSQNGSSGTSCRRTGTPEGRCWPSPHAQVLEPAR